MTDSTARHGHRGQLRQDAEARLKAGITPPAISAPFSVDALALLHKLASNPDSATDALKLLHELQVHQVELDLQHLQLDANERDLADSLARYKALYDFAPAGYLILGRDGKVIKANRASTELLGIGLKEIVGHPIASVLAPESQPILAGLLDNLRNDGVVAYCDAKPANVREDSRQVRITASVSPGGDTVLMVMTRQDTAQAAV